MEQTRLQWRYTSHNASTPHKGHCKRMRNDLAERLDLLKSLPMFRSLDDELLRYLAEESRRRQFEAEDVICYQGDPGSTCHIVVQGRVRIFVIGDDGRELSVRILGPGEIVGEMAIFENLPRSASVEALERTLTLEMHREVLFECLQRSTTLALNLLQAMSARLRSSTVETEKMSSLTVVERVMRRLRQLAEWSGKPVSDGVRIVVPMTQQELATMVGTSRESVNRALVQLRRQGKVRLEKGWIVLLNEGSRSTPDPNDE